MYLDTAQEYLNKQVESLDNHISRRSRLQTYCDVLHAISIGLSKPTPIMYRANLSWKVLREHLDLLIRQELIAPFGDQGRTHYRITSKGESLLERYQTIENNLKIEE